MKHLNFVVREIKFAQKNNPLNVAHPYNSPTLPISTHSRRVSAFV